MIDTIKFLVPIDNVLALQRLKSGFTQIKKENLKTGSVEYEFYSSKVELGSYKRGVVIRINDTVPLGLFIEFSIPKYVKGNNVEMIYPHQVPTILGQLYSEICSHIEYPIPHFCNWIIYRLDICYNWVFKTPAEATTVMGFIQRIEYPRKQKYLYETSVMYRGSAYTIKFYLKGAEFKKNDYKALENGTDRPLQLQEWANKIVRFEIGFKKREVDGLFGYSPTFFSHISDDKAVEEVLNFYLKDKVFRYLTTKNTTEAELEEKLYSNFSKIKATRLYQFYQAYYLEDGGIKKRIKDGGIHRSTVYRYKKELKKLGIGFDLRDSSGKGLLEELIIPSGNSMFDLVGFPEKEVPTE
jgi:II/X family phage/plasmid replication protein